jgi:UDP-N-acetylmuramate--alanine ligase
MQGERVSGSDLVRTSKTDEIEALGATLYEGHAASNIADDVTTVVYSSAVRPENPEYAEAAKRGIRLVRRANFMGELLEGHKVIAVAGTHGKTTTTSMIASMLIEAKLDPVVLVGAAVKELGNKNARAGKGKIAVVEADEYDRSFLTLKPFIAVMTSLEAEHLDIYKDLDDLKETFITFANQGPSTWNTGYAVVCIDEPALRQITPRLEKRIVAYGASSLEAKYRVANVTYSGQKTKATVLRGGERLGDLELTVPGEHNLKNALAALAVGEVLSIPFETTRKALKRFGGAERRFQVVGEAATVLVVDDYAHHPTEIRATLETAKRSYPNRRIVACFQPHTFTRTRDFAVEFGKALAELADVIVLLDIYPAREEPIQGITSDLILSAAQEHGAKDITLLYSVEELPEHLSGVLQAGDVVLTIGAGTITNASQAILEELKKREFAIQA